MKHFILTGLLLSATAVAYPAMLSPEEALSRALASGSMKAPRPVLQESYSLQWTGENNSLYMFAAPAGGFLITPASDLYPAVIGYSDTMNRQKDVLPEALEVFLKALDCQIASGQLPEKAPGVERAPIEPLTKALWGQDAPFDGMTPLIDGSPALTGCMATAMAEVLNYWKYPVNGTGYNSYYWNRQTVSYDFSKSNFDWDNMLDFYTDEATQVQKDAVANLMFACGVACDMDYSLTFSGAADANAGIGLTKYLGYDQGLDIQYRDFYRIAEWTEMLYTELSEGRPVIYTGFSTAGGHAFVCDGYLYDDGLDYYHINWGWNGDSNGYFLINILNPERVGLGATESGFNMMQSAFIGLKPSDGTPSERPAPNVVCFGYFSMGAYEYTRGDDVLLGVAAGLLRAGIYNMSMYSVEVDTGISLTDKETGEKYYFGSNNNQLLAPSEGIITFYVNSKNFPEGTFIVHPAGNIEGVWQDLPEEVGLKTDMEVTVEGDKITFSSEVGSDMILVNNIVVDDYLIKADEPFFIEAELESVNLFEPSLITPVLLDSKYYILSTAQPQVVLIEPGETQIVKWDAVFNPLPPAGVYTLGLLNEKSILLAYSIDVMVVDEDMVCTVNASNVRINRRLASPVTPTPIEEDNFDLTFTLKCESGWFDGEIVTRLSHNGVTDIETESHEFYLLQGQSENVVENIDVSSLEIGETYQVAIFAIDNDGERQLAETYLISKEESGVESILSDNDAIYYTVDGICLEGKPAVPGIYILSSNGKTSKIVIR